MTIQVRTMIVRTIPVLLIMLASLSCREPKLKRCVILQGDDIRVDIIGTQVGVLLEEGKTCMYVSRETLHDGIERIGMVCGDNLSGYCIDEEGL